MKFSYHLCRKCVVENIKHINKLDPLKMKAHVQSASVLTEC